MMQRSVEELQQLNIGLPMQLGVSEKSKNRLYLSWRNAKGGECKMVGPETKCFCNHKFKDHQYLNPKGKKAPCKVPKCKCTCFDYIPSHGAYDFKCLCKHSFKEHDYKTRKCNRPNCTQCKGFHSAWTCGCGSKWSEHETVIQSYEERKQAGRAMGDMARMGEELNQLTNQGSLYKPVKVDPESRFLKRQSQNPYSKQKIQIKEEEEVEEVRFDRQRY